MRMASDDSAGAKDDQFTPCDCDSCPGRRGRIDLDHPGVLRSRGRYRIWLRLLALRPPAVSYPRSRGDFLRHHHGVPHLSTGPFEKRPLELRACTSTGPGGSLEEVKRERGPAPMRVLLHAAVIWPITGVKVQPVPFMTIERDRSTSTVSLVVVPDRTSNGVTAFTSPEGTLNTTFVPSSIRPVAAITTSRISVYLPGPTRALASSSDTFTRDARSIDD